VIRRVTFFGPLLFLGLVAVAATLSACGQGQVITGTQPTAVPFTSGTVFVSDPSKNQIAIFAPSPGPNTIPANPIQGSATQLNGPVSMAFDGNHNLYVSNYNPTTNSSSITVFSVGSQGNVAPTLAISGSNTQLGVVSGIAVDSSLNIYVSNCSNTSPNCSTGTSSILVFAKNANGNVAPMATIGGPQTLLAGPRGLGFDIAGNLWVANSGNASVTQYSNPSQGGNLTPKTIIQGSATNLQTPSDVIIDASSNIYVADSTQNAIYVFAASAAGNASPIRTIQGSNTKLNAPSGIALAADGTLYVANTNDVLLFPPVSGVPPNTNVAPEATLSNTLGAVSDVELSI